MSEEMYYLTLDDYERRVIINALNDQRTDRIQANQDTDDIDELIIKAVDAPKKKAKGILHAWR